MYRYSYGFNGKENDSEIKGNGNSYDFGARMYDPRLGRFLSIDPLANKYVGESPYGYAGNSPVLFVDKEGEKKITYMQIIAKDGTKTTIKVVNKYEVAVINYGPQFTMTGYSNQYEVEYDIIVHLRIDYSNLNPDGTPSISKPIVYLNEVGKEKGITAIPGNGGTIEAEFGDGEAIDISDMVGALGGMSGGAGLKNNALDFAKVFKVLSDMYGTVEKAVKGINDGQKIDLSGKKGVKKDATGFTINDDGTAAKSFNEGNLYKNEKGDTSRFYDKSTQKTGAYKNEDKAKYKTWTDEEKKE